MTWSEMFLLLAVAAFLGGFGSAFALRSFEWLEDAYDNWRTRHADDPLEEPAEGDWPAGVDHEWADQVADRHASEWQDNGYVPTVPIVQTLSMFPEDCVHCLLLVMGLADPMPEIEAAP